MSGYPWFGGKRPAVPGPLAGPAEMIGTDEPVARAGASARLGLAGGLFGVLVLAAAYHWGFTTESPRNVLGLILLAAAGLVDLQRRAIPDRLTLPALAWVLAASVIWVSSRLLEAPAGALGVGGSCLCSLC